MAKDSPFPAEEFEQRWAEIQAEMARRGVDLLLLDQPEMVVFAIGYAMSEGMAQYCIIPAEGSPAVVIRNVDLMTCQEASWATDVVGYADWEDPIEVVASVVETREWPTGRIGVDKNSYSLTLLRFEALERTFDDAQFDDFSDWLAERRARKSEWELDYIGRACRIADATYDSLLQRLRPGDSVRKCAAEAARQIIERGGDPGVVGPICRNIDDRKMHTLVNDDRVEEGDILHVELIPQYAGYGARIMRPVSMGPAAGEALEHARQIVAIQDRQFEAMVPGAAAHEVDEIVRTALVENGLKSAYTNITGYSLGYYQLFTARSSDFSYVFRPGERWRLAPGMVFHMYTVAQGLAFSDTVCIREDGPQRLTRTSRKILEIDTRNTGADVTMQ